VILILMLVVVLGGVIAQLVANKAYRSPLGAVGIVLLAAAALAGSAWMWDNVTEHDAVSVILVLIGAAAGALVALRVWRAPIANTGLRAALLVVVAALTVWAAVELAGLDLGDSAAQVPVMLFGLGAIGLAQEPRGVIYDIVNRQRLRRFKDAERREEEERLRAEPAPRTAAVTS
jgi:hypothetical protein